MVSGRQRSVGIIFAYKMSQGKRSGHASHEVFVMGREPAWRLARRNPRAWRRGVGEMMRSRHLPLDLLIDSCATSSSTEETVPLALFFSSVGWPGDVLFWLPWNGYWYQVETPLCAPNTLRKWLCLGWWPPFYLPSVLFMPKSRGATTLVLVL